MKRNSFPNGKSTVFSLVLLFLAALFLRFYGLDTRGLWWDEISLWHQGLTGFRSPHIGPFSPWLQGVWMQLVGSDSDFMFHIPPVIAGALSIFPAYLLAVELSADRSNRMMGLSAAALVTMSPILVYYSQEARPYGFLMLFTSILCLSFIKSVKRPTFLNWTAYTIALALSCLTHLGTLMYVGGGALYWVLIFVRNYRMNLSFSPTDIRSALQWVAATGIGVTLGCTWIFFRQGQLSSTWEGLYPEGAGHFVATALMAMGPSFLHASNNSLLILAVAMGGLCVIGLRYSMMKCQKLSGLFVASSLVVCLITLYITLGPKGYWTWKRYLSHLVIPYLVLVSVGWHTIISRFRSSRLFPILCLSLTAAFGPGLTKWAADAPKDRSSRFKRKIHAVEKYQANLAGVLVLAEITRYGDETARSISYFHKYDHRIKIPIYRLDSEGPRRISAKPTLDGVSNIAPKAEQKTLAPGIYALVSRLNEPCHRIPWRKGEFKPVNNAQSNMKMKNNGLRFCRFAPNQLLQ